MPQSQQRQIRAVSATNTTAHGNTGSLTHWARPRMEPATSWFLVGFISTVPWRELLFFFFVQIWSLSINWFGKYCSSCSKCYLRHPRVKSDQYKIMHLDFHLKWFILCFGPLIKNKRSGWCSSAWPTLSSSWQNHSYLHLILFSPFDTAQVLRVPSISLL